MSSRVLNYSLPDYIRVRDPNTVFTLEEGLQPRMKSHLQNLIDSQLEGDPSIRGFFSYNIATDAFNKLEEDKQRTYLICLSDRIKKRIPILILSDESYRNPIGRSLKKAFIEGEI